MMMSRANSAPVITFSVPTVQVTPVPVGGSLLRTSTDPPSQLSSQPLPLPRPPRCLTPYPDTSNFPHSLEPSPLSSPAFSAYCMASSNGDRSINTDTNTKEEGDTDVEDLDLNVDVRVAGPMSPKEVMSPGARARADNAKLLAPALYMSHMNSPTDQRFREMPLSPMRKLKLESAEQSGMTSPIYSGPTPNLYEKEEKPVFTFSCSSPGSPSEAVGIWLDEQRKAACCGEEKLGRDGEDIVHQEYANRHEPGEGGVPSLDEAHSGQVLEVHVETVD